MHNIHGMNMGVRGLLVSQLFASTIGVPRMRLKISGLAANIFAC